MDSWSREELRSSIGAWSRSMPLPSAVFMMIFGANSYYENQIKTYCQAHKITGPSPTAKNSMRTRSKLFLLAVVMNAYICNIHWH